jgi:hypothetical protein
MSYLGGSLWQLNNQSLGIATDEICTDGIAHLLNLNQIWDDKYRRCLTYYVYFNLEHLPLRFYALI